MAYSKARRLAEIVSDTSGNLSVEGIIVPTQSNSDNDTSAASTAFVHAHVNALVDSAPGTLNTLNELAAALNDQDNFGSTITTAVNAKLPLAGGTLTGHLTIADDIRLKFGAGADMQMYHVNANGRNYISTADLEISANSFRLFNTAGTTGMMTATASAISLLQPTTITNSLTLQDDFASGVAITLNRTESSLVDTNFYIGVTSSGSAANDRMWLGTATTDLTITDEGNVGIGSDNPDAYDSRAEKLVVEESGDAGITIAGGSGSDCRLVFATAGQTDLSNGSITYDQNTDNMSFETGGTARLSILSTGNVQFQGTTTTFVSKGFTPHSNGYLYLRGGSGGLRLDDDSSINTIQIADGSSGYIKFETGDGTERMRIAADGETTINHNLRIANNGTATAGTVPLEILGTRSDTIAPANATAKFYGYSNGDGLAIGHYASAPYGSYLQSGYLLDTYATPYNNGYPILLNPLGGAVGIGTSNPDSLLDVDGVINIKSNPVIDSDGTSHYFKTPSGGAMYFYHGTANIMYVSSAGLMPGADNAKDLGSTSKRWRNVYTTDLHLSNEGKPEGNQVDGTTGNWTIQEGEENLYIINNKSGKKYKFALEEIE